MSAALFAVLLSWFTLTPKMPYLQIVHTIIMGMGVQGGWLLFSALLGDICDEDERQTGLRQEGIYSAVMGFCNKCAGVFVGRRRCLHARIFLVTLPAWILTLRSATR